MSSNRFAAIQQLGRTLMLPIAVLPIAGLLLRLGQPDLLNIAFIAEAGNAIFANLPLLFAIGVAFGFAKESNGVAALAGAVGYFVLTAAMKTIDAKINMGVLSGLIIGAVAGGLYNRYKDIKLPEWLAFFGGKRFVPIITGLAGLVLAIVFGFIWPPIQAGIDAIGHWLIGSGEIGLFIYGVLNRLLLVTGLHHILNNLVWFVFGDFTNAAGAVVHGDLNRFFAGDPTAGGFMTGFFPVMMFGLPAACLAIYRSARKENRHLVGGMLLSMALTSFLTGVTEPIEFSFMFLAPVLYGLHAVLTGLSLAIMHVLNVKAGFTFSAGAFDYVLSYGISKQSWIIIPVGLCYFVVYYGLFTFFIRRFNLATMGREAPQEAGITAAAAQPVAAGSGRVGGYIAALGGAGNIVDVEACTTRLRLMLNDSQLANDEALRALGAKGVIRASGGTMQVVVGTTAELLADEMKGALKAAAPAAKADGGSRAHQFIAALGGAANVQNVDACTTRLRLQVADNALVRDAELKALGARGLIRPSAGNVQIVLGPIADSVADEIRSALKGAA
jgi:PTS system N-acetylglucosamine-specific IIC component